MDQNEELMQKLNVALGGIIFAFVALYGLTLYRQFNLKREGLKKLPALRKAAEGAADAPPGSTRFFVARFRGSSPRFFRVYVDDGALLFIHTGPYFALTNVETARGEDSRHWLLQAGGMLMSGLAAGSAIAIGALAMIGRSIAQSATKNPDGATDIMMIIMGIIAFCAVMFIIIAPGIVWRVVRRGRELSALPLSGLREQAETHPLSFRATPANVSNIKINPLDLDSKYSSGNGWGATLQFKHGPTGKWKLETATTQDTHQAVQEFQRLFGPTAIELDLSLERRFGIERSADAK